MCGGWTEGVQIVLDLDRNSVDVNHRLKRLMYEEQVYLSVADLIYLGEASRDRFRCEGNPQAADAMERLTFVLSMLTLVE